MKAAVVLAAGKGTRLRSSRAKVLHELAGRSLLGWVLEALRPLALDRVVVVCGHQAEAVAAEAELLSIPGLVTVVQEPQNGTGHAVRTAVEAGALDGADEVVVVPGDVPGITTETVRRLIRGRGRAAAAVLTTDLDDPAGYGRIVRSEHGAVTAIVEHRDATDDQRRITEVNTALFAFAHADLVGALSRLDTDNAQGEEYLTDTVAVLAGEPDLPGGARVVAVRAAPEEVRGVNDQAQLSEVEALLRQRLLLAHMAAGVRVMDPATTYVDADVRIEADATILPGTILQGGCVIAHGASVGPYSRLVDTRVDEGAEVTFTVATGAVIGPHAIVGPYTHLRPGTVLGPRTKAGGFVEMKQAEIGEGSKVPHLSYVGDAVIGSGVNLGAGTVTVNYDGFDKHRTTIGDGAFIGSDTMLVAPIDVGEGAVVGAGSTISHDVPADALVVERAQARTVDGWAANRRARHARPTEGPADDQTPQS